MSLPGQSNQPLAVQTWLDFLLPQGPAKSKMAVTLPAGPQPTDECEKQNFVL